MYEFFSVPIWETRGQVSDLNRPEERRKRTESSSLSSLVYTGVDGKTNSIAELERCQITTTYLCPNTLYVESPHGVDQ